VIFESIRFENLHFAYQVNHPLVRGATVDFPLNCNVWLKGAPGSGKSVIFKLIIGLLVPQQGDYLINGQSIHELSFNDFQIYRLKMGYGFDNGGLFNN
jgi:phospholipid/cholesterol/gamma-HCH transport system ATP-binding protein